PCGGHADRARPGPVLQPPRGTPLRAVRAGGQARAAGAAMSAAPPFCYEGFDLDPERGLLTCRYSLGGRDFTEKITFGPGGNWDEPGVAQAARLVCLLAGVSYYKTAAPPVIDLGRVPVTAAELGFLRGFYLAGAGREIDPQLLRSAELGFLNGHVPVTGILSAIAVMAALLDGRDAVVMSNEWSASVATLQAGGRPINHQYSKSMEFEAGFRQVLA